ncbi:MAG: glutamate 5-kinase [Anaerolineae bacterium]|nr:glutamate 5-kinase [Anaerolineae bacterium]
MPKYRRVVIKIGTSVLTEGTRKLSHGKMVDLARQCSALHQQGYDIIVCTSGAIAAGRERLDYPNLPTTVANKQMLAAIGQSKLMLLWEQFFDIYGVHVGQILLTHGDVESRHRFLNAQDTLNALIKHRIIPIINENDAVATEEIKIGDNDNLSALVAVLVGADLLILLTDQSGLYTADPNQDPNAELIAYVDAIDEQLRAVAGKSHSSLGVGGMETKLDAAMIARRAGTEVIIASGTGPDAITHIVEGKAQGTRFTPIDTPLENRKRWVLAGPVNSGRIVVDEGAAFALQHKGRSLLPAGITHIDGVFDRGDTVSIIAGELRKGAKAEIARGISRYNSEDLDRIKRCHSDRFEYILGYTYGAVAVHRNDLILLVSK